MFFPKKQDAWVQALADTANAAVQGRSPWADARLRFGRNRAAFISLVILVVITLACIIGPWVLPNAYDSADWDAMSLAPSLTNWHLFGTDEAGRDLLVRSLIGGRISLMVGVLATLASVTIGRPVASRASASSSSPFSPSPWKLYGEVRGL